MSVSRRDVLETGGALALLGGIAAATRAHAASPIATLAVAAPSADPVGGKHNLLDSGSAGL